MARLLELTQIVSAVEAYPDLASALGEPPPVDSVPRAGAPAEN